MRNIYSEIQNNKSTTMFIILGFTGFVILMAYIASFFVGSGSFPFLAGIGFVFSGVSAFVSYYFSDKIVLSITGAKEVSKQDYPELHSMVEKLSVIAGLPKPRVFIMEDSAMNAFATGRNPEHGVVCFTTGIIDRLEMSELEGVTAHELAHIGNYDIRLSSIVSVLVGMVVLVSDYLSHGMLYSAFNDEEEGMSPVTIALVIVSIIAAPIIATMIQLAVSRNREFLADATAANLTKNPNALARALEKISGDTEVLEAANGATAHMYFSNPLQNTHSFGSKIANLFSTHPPASERIKRLREM